MMTDILVLVNQDFHNDPRVNRAVKFLAKQGYQLAVVSGTTQKPDQYSKNYAWGRLYYYRTYKAGQMSWLRPLTRFATANQKTVDSVRTKARFGFIKRFFKSLIYLAQFLKLFWLNLLLVIRFYSLPAKLYYPNDFDVIAAATLLAWLHRKPLIYETHELSADQLIAYPNWYRQIISWFEGRWARRASHVITVGTFIAQILQTRYDLDNQPVVIRSCPPYRSVTRAEDSERPLKLLYHGLYQPERGLEQLILAMHHTEHARLYLRGFGYWETPLRELVGKENLKHKVFFLPPVAMNDLVEAASPFDIGVDASQVGSLNSRYRLPNKVFEYMMAGLALAVSDIPELRTIVDNYDVGIKFDASDPEDIAHKVNDLAMNLNLLSQMQANALRVARDVFNFEREGEKLYQIIESIIGPPIREA